MDLLGRFAYMFVLVMLGLGARQVGVLTETRNERLGQLAFYVFLPALIFVSTYDEDLEALVSPRLVAGLLTMFAVLMSLAWLANRHGPDELRSVALVQSYHANTGYFGLPVVAATLGAAATATASVVFGLAALVQVPLTVLVLVTINDADAPLGSELERVATNPILLTLAASLVFATYDLPVSSAALVGLERLSTLALPFALVAVGGSLQPTTYSAPLDRTASVVGLKVVVMPVVAWLVFWALGADVVVRNTSVVMFGAPTAVSTYVYVSELGGDTEFASMNVFVTTLTSLVTLFVLLQVIA